jgi:hypothetical protein
VIVDKKLREFEKDQVWWGCHQTARAKKFWHFSTANGICCLEDDENVHSEDDLEEVIREVITVTDISTTPMSMNKGLKRSDVKIIVGIHYGATYSSMFPPLLKKIMLT